MQSDGNSNDYSFSFGEEYDYFIRSAVFYNQKEPVYPAGWVKEQCEKTKEFVRNHKKEIIIGAAILVATVAIVATVVVVSGVAALGTATAGAAGASALKESLDNKAGSFKETISKEQLLPPPDSMRQPEQLSLEEKGRTLGSLFAHDTLKNLDPQATHAQDIGHLAIDRKFSTDYSYKYTTPGSNSDFSTVYYQAQGEKALTYGYNNQALESFGKVIELDPSNPDPYLDRSIAYLNAGQHEKSIEDYNTYTKHSLDPVGINEFGSGFVKGLRTGVCDSAKGMVNFGAELATHPVLTSVQLYHSFKHLNELAKSDEWETLAQILAPELHQLVTNWENLSPTERGNLAGYAFGKLGSDIVVPGAAGKLAAKGVKTTRVLKEVRAGCEAAEKTLLLESTIGLETGAKIAEVVQLENQVSGWLGEGTQFIRNKAGDPIFISKDGLRKLRFDFNRPAPHESPHLHLEQFVDGEWQEISRVYPIDVPHR